MPHLTTWFYSITMTCVDSIDLIQPDSKVVQPGQSLTISCQVSGYSLTDSSYATGWIRQREGKPMDWIFHQWGSSSGNFYQNDAVKNKFSYSRDISAGTVTITGQNLQPEDTAVYYCVRMPHSDTNKHKPGQKLNTVLRFVSLNHIIISNHKGSQLSSCWFVAPSIRETRVRIRAAPYSLLCFCASPKASGIKKNHCQVNHATYPQIRGCFAVATPDGKSRKRERNHIKS
uniref:Ig-like domain-containing protein n=1 Tax=Oryzias sinensis TaxID=183150 RepID=A0A8C7Y634_9TELE